MKTDLITHVIRALAVLLLSCVSALAAPSISTQPLAQTKNQGQSASFSVAATGAGALTYQWQKDGVDIPSATSSTYSIASVQPQHIGYYACKVTDSGGITTTSMKARLYVRKVPTPAGALFGWGQFAAPTLDNVVSVSVSDTHGLALKSNGTVVAYGDNTYGKTDIPTGLSGVIAVATGTRHSLALKSDGSVVAWGDNTYGQCNVPAGLNSVTAISSAREGFFSVALKSDGTLAVWGDNRYGQCNIPVSVSGVVDVAAGGDHVIALKGDGTLVVWGRNNYGQCTVPPGLTDTIYIAAGHSHTLALKANGTVIGFGWQEGWRKNANNIVTMPENLTEVEAIGCGATHNIALKKDGSIVAWGAGLTNTGSWPEFGQSIVPQDSRSIIGISAGGYMSVAIYASSPTVTLTGSNPLTFEAAASYTDPGATASDVGGGALTPTITSNTVVPNVPGTYAVTWSATDSSNNTGTAVRTVNVVDTTAPVIATHADVSVAATSPSGAVVFYADATATDVVGVTSFNYSQASGTVFPIGSTSVTITARDAANNSSTRTFTVNVLWGGEPLISTAPQPQSNLVAGNSAVFSVSAIGNGLTYQWLRNGKPIRGAVGATLTLPGIGADDAGIYTCRISNPLGRTTTEPAALTIADAKLLIYRIKGKETNEETGSVVKAGVSGWLIVDRANQQGAFIWTGKQGALKVYSIERRADLATNSTGPVPGSATLLVADTASGAHPQVEHDLIWLKGADALLTLSPLDQAIAPGTLSGTVGRLSLTGGTQIEARSISLVLDKPKSLLSRANNDTLEQAITRIENALIIAGYGKIP